MMPTPASTLLASISRRVRDDNQTAHTASFILDLLDRVQVIVNAQQEAITTTRVVTNTKNTSLYSLEGDLQGLTAVQNVRIAGQRLDEITPWRDLYKLSATWLTDTGIPQGWARLGQTLIAVWPAPASDIQLDFQGVALPTPLTTNSVDLELALEDEDIAREIMVALLLMRQRDIDSVKEIIGRLASKVQLQEMSDGKSRRSHARQ